MFGPAAVTDTAVRAAVVKERPRRFGIIFEYSLSAVFYFSYSGLRTYSSRTDISTTFLLSC